MDIEACLEYLLPDPGYKGTAHFADRADYESRGWVDKRPKPKWAELEAVWPEVEEAIAPPPPPPDRIAELAAKVDEALARLAALEDARTP